MNRIHDSGSTMTGDASRMLTQEGLRHIEDAIMRLLAAHPQGLRNAQIADALGLRSSIHDRQRDYLTYSVLGGLMARGAVTQDSETKIFTIVTNAGNL